MEIVLLEPTEGMHSTSVFSPQDQFRSAHEAVGTGEHHMVLRASENSLYEREVSCYINGIKVGILHEDEAHDYYSSIKKLNKYGFELSTPCTFSETNVIHFMSMTHEMLSVWVDEKVEPKPSADPAPRLSSKPEDKFDSRVNHHVLRLLSQEYFLPSELPDAEKIARGVYWYEREVLGDSIGVRQSNALVMLTYALYRVSGNVFVREHSMMLDGISGIETPVLVIDDEETVRLATESPNKALDISQRVISGLLPSDESLDRLRDDS